MTKQEIQEHSLALELFFRYNRNKMLLQHQNFHEVPSTLCASSDSRFDKMRELYKCYVQRIINDLQESHNSSGVAANNPMYFREHVNLKWQSADELTKSVFTELAREGRGGVQQQHSRPSKLFRMQDHENIDCPIVHIPHHQPSKQLNGPSRSPIKKRKVLRDDPPTTKSLSQNSRKSKKSRTPGCNTAKLPVLVKLTDIISLTGKGEDIDDNEVRIFLSKLNWD